MGFLISFIFNADTLGMIEKLSSDPDVRAKIVNMAIEYNKQLAEQEKNKQNDSISLDSLSSEERLKQIKQRLSREIKSTNYSKEKARNLFCIQGT
jgi:hypothetical protein